jgi:hypothetical protein
MSPAEPARVGGGSTINHPTPNVPFMGLHRSVLIALRIEEQVPVWEGVVGGAHPITLRTRAQPIDQPRPTPKAARVSQRRWNQSAGRVIGRPWPGRA